MSSHGEILGPEKARKSLLRDNSKRHTNEPGRKFFNAAAMYNRALKKQTSQPNTTLTRVQKAIPVATQRAERYAQIHRYANGRKRNADLNTRTACGCGSRKWPNDMQKRNKTYNCRVWGTHTPPIPLPIFQDRNAKRPHRTAVHSNRATAWGKCCNAKIQIRRTSLNFAHNHRDKQTSKQILTTSLLGCVFLAQPQPYCSTECCTMLMF